MRIRQAGVAPSWRGFIVAAAGAVALVAAGPRVVAGQSPPSRDEDLAAVTHLLQRATFGARAADVERAVSISSIGERRQFNLDSLFLHLDLNPHVNDWSTLQI